MKASIANDNLYRHTYTFADISKKRGQIDLFFLLSPLTSNLSPLTFYLFAFNRVKALSKDTTDIGLTNKSIRVDGFDDMKDQLTLLFAC